MFNVNNINQQDRIELRVELGIKKDNFVVSYLGSIGTWYMLDEMLLFFKQLLARKTNSLFFFITGEQQGLIFDKCNRYNIPIDSIIVKRAERKDVPLYLSLSSLNIFFILPVYSKKASSPTKQGEVMGMGIPIVCNSGVGDTEEIIRNGNAGYVLDEFTEEAFNKLLNQITDYPKSSENIRHAVKYFSLSEGVKRYNKIYQHLLKNNN